MYCIISYCNIESANDGEWWVVSKSYSVRQYCSIPLFYAVQPVSIGSVFAILWVYNHILICRISSSWDHKHIPYIGKQVGILPHQPSKTPYSIFLLNEYIVIQIV